MGKEGQIQKWPRLLQARCRTRISLQGINLYKIESFSYSSNDRFLTRVYLQVEGSCLEALLNRHSDLKLQVDFDTSLCKSRLQPVDTY